MGLIDQNTLYEIPKQTFHLRSQEAKTGRSVEFEVSLAYTAKWQDSQSYLEKPYL